LRRGSPQQIVYIKGAKYYIHTVQAGETLYGLSKTYGVGEKVILENNPSIARGLKTAENHQDPLRGRRSRNPSRTRSCARPFDFHFESKGRRRSTPFRAVRDPV